MRWRTAAGLLGVMVAPWLALAPATATVELGDRAELAELAERAAAGEQDDSAKKAKKAKKAKQARKAARLAASAPEPGETKKASVMKTGWWWIINEPPPDTGVLAAPQPPSPHIPAGSMPVGALLGSAEKVAAIELVLDAEPGSTVSSLTMVLRETESPAANLNAESAVVLACPVTEVFWANGEAAAWKHRPAHDCDAGVPGVRGDDGLWTFDLTSFATGWLAEGSTASRSVALVEAVEAPDSFQVTFDGPKVEGVGLALEATPPSDTDDGTGEDDFDGGDDGGIDSGNGGGGNLGSGGSGGSLDSGGSDAPPVEDSPPGSEPTAAETGDGELSADVAPVASLPSWYDGIPRAGYLLLPLALGLAYLIMVALGPEARPVPTTGRHGVSRALDRLRQAGRDLRSAR